MFVCCGVVGIEGNVCGFVCVSLGVEFVIELIGFLGVGVGANDGVDGGGFGAGVIVYVMYGCFE